MNNQEHDPVGWVKSTVFYQIFPDRFARSSRAAGVAHLETWDSPPTLHGFKGGDLLGIVEKLDYLQDLGCNGIYLNPIFSSTANHRYHTYDYFVVDPILGGESAYRALITECRKRGIKVVLDGVFNHASRGFYQFSHTLENGKDSPYKDWFHFNSDWLKSGRPINAYCSEPRRFAPPNAESSLDLYGYRAWWDIPALPKFNTANPEVREYLWKVAEYWIHQGIDGWRLDVASEIDDDGFWQEFRRRVKKINPSAYIVGEIWNDARRWLAGDQFDGVTNYPLGQLLLGFCVRDTLNFQELDRSGLKSTRLVGGHECQLGLTELFAKYPEHAVFHQLNFITSHDTPRLLTLASGDVDGVLMIMTGFMTLPGAPCIYYGEEIGMSGGQDPDCRRGFEWDHQLWNQKIMSHTRRLAKLRHQEASLQEGLYQALYADEGVMVYRRHLAGSDSVIGINTKHETVTILIQNLLFTGQGAPDGELWAEGTMTNGPLRLKRSTVGAGVDLTLELKARSSGVWCRPS